MQDLEPVVHEALMEILCAIYESGMVEEVDLGLVLQLVGFPPDDDAPYINFRDPGWVQEYIRYKQMVPDDAKVTFVELDEDDPFAQSLKEHLGDLGIDIDDGDLPTNKKLH